MSPVLATMRPRRGLFRSLAAFATRYAASYESALAVRKRALLSRLEGRILELGPGGGANLPYLAAGPTRRIEWIGLEPSLPMQRELRVRAKSLGIEARVVTGVGEALPFDDGSMDAVVGTLVLCSVSDAQRTLAEIRRVLRPGGRFAFVEHVAAAPGTGLRCRQDLVAPLWRLVADGCRPAPETAALLSRASFTDVRLEHFDAPAGLLTPHVAGVAVR